MPVLPTTYDAIRLHDAIVMHAHKKQADLHPNKIHQYKTLAELVFLGWGLRSAQVLSGAKIPKELVSSDSFPRSVRLPDSLPGEVMTISLTKEKKPAVTTPEQELAQLDYSLDTL